MACLKFCVLDKQLSKIKNTLGKKRHYYRKASHRYSYRAAISGEVDATYKDRVMKVCFQKPKGTEPGELRLKEVRF